MPRSNRAISPSVSRNSADSLTRAASSVLAAQRRFRSTLRSTASATPSRSNRSAADHANRSPNSSVFSANSTSAGQHHHRLRGMRAASHQEPPATPGRTVTRHRRHTYPPETAEHADDTAPNRTAPARPRNPTPQTRTSFQRPPWTPILVSRPDKIGGKTAQPPHPELSVKRAGPESYSAVRQPDDRRRGPRPWGWLGLRRRLTGSGWRATAGLLPAPGGPVSVPGAVWSGVRASWRCAQVSLGAPSQSCVAGGCGERRAGSSAASDRISIARIQLVMVVMVPRMVLARIVFGRRCVGVAVVAQVSARGAWEKTPVMAALARGVRPMSVVTGLTPPAAALAPCVGCGVVGCGPAASDPLRRNVGGHAGQGAGALLAVEVHGVRYHSVHGHGVGCIRLCRCRFRWLAACASRGHHRPALAGVDLDQGPRPPGGKLSCTSIVFECPIIESGCRGVCLGRGAGNGCAFIPRRIIWGRFVEGAANSSRVVRVTGFGRFVLVATFGEMH